ncbi:Imm52 family immunity protein [Kribbella sp. NPDC006257]|uniref:Imm52 family immunity protein n=1 Tax=Kribbella sp. NPDC006257 TaxID=3156738 RepID=UPI0033BD2EBC
MRKWIRPISAHTGERRESVEVCAVRLARCLAGLADVHPLLSVWYRTAPRRSAANVKIDTEVAALAEILLTNRSSSAGDRGSAVDKLGFSIALWNGADP